MISWVMRLLARFLVAFAFAVVSWGHAEGPRFATGFLIYKSVPGDVPAYYNGLLYLSAAPPAALWKEYDVGQAKPFRIENGLIVSEIKFGALFSADFTTDEQVDFCKGILAQLAAAVAQSPKLKGAAQAASASVQAEMDRYQKGEVRFRGQWMTRLAQQDILNEEERQRAAAMAAQRAIEAKVKADAAAMWEAGRQKRLAQEAYEAEERIRRSNLSLAFKPLSAQYMITSFEVFTNEATVEAQAGRALDFSLPPDEGAIPLPRNPHVTLEMRANREGSETEMSMMCAYDQNSRLVSLFIGFFLVADSSGQKLINTEQVDTVRATLAKMDEQVFGLLPDVVAATSVRHMLGQGAADRPYTFSALTATHAAEFIIGLMNDTAGTQRQFVLIKIRPEPSLTP